MICDCKAAIFFFKNTLFYFMFTGILTWVSGFPGTEVTDSCELP